MSYDDDPYNDGGGDRKWLNIALVVLFCLAVFTLVAWAFGVKVKAQDYLPPQRFRTPQAQEQPQDDGPQQYYANDWIVYAPDGRVLCKDPYIELDLKTIRCIATEKWR